MVVGRVEVHDRAFPPDRRHELVHTIAEGRFARPGWSNDYLGEGHVVDEAESKCSSEVDSSLKWGTLEKAKLPAAEA